MLGLLGGGGGGWGIDCVLVFVLFVVVCFCCLFIFVCYCCLLKPKPVMLLCYKY